MPAEWHILGLGAIGSLFATALNHAGCHCSALVRRGAVNTNERERIRLVVDGSTHETTLNRTVATDTCPISHLLVTTKAYDARSAVASVAHRLTSDSQIVLLMNGMGILEELESDHPGLTFFCGTTTDGAYRTPTGDVIHAGHGITRLGSVRNQALGEPPTWFQDWERLSLTCSWETDIHRVLWQKLTVNCAINPLTALHRCNNGELAVRVELDSKLDVLCEEIALIATAAGYETKMDTLRNDVDKVVRDTAANRSSMLQDVLAGRPTEIDYISGYLVEVARRLDIPAPTNEQLFKDVKDLAS